MKLFLLGFYGYENIGDEALLMAIVNSLKKSNRHTFKVLSYNAKQTKLQHHVEAVSRGKNFKILTQIKNADAVIVGGGSILQDVTSSKSLYYYLAMLTIGKLMGKKVYLLGNGFGPITNPFNSWLLKRLIPHIDGIIARDQESYQHFAAYGAKRLYNGVDCVFSLNTEKVVAHRQARPYVVVSLRPWKNMDLVKEIVKKGILKLNQAGYDTILLPMKSPDDRDMMSSLLELGDFVHLAPSYSGEVYSYIKGASFVIGMRLHALILASVMLKPVIAISYDPKVNSLIRQMYKREVETTETITERAFDDKLTHLIEYLESEQTQVIKIVPNIHRIALAQIDEFENWLDN